MGKKFEDNEQGKIDMAAYISDCLKKYPHTVVKTVDEKVEEEQTISMYEKGLGAF
jgi:hypothetical protein